MKSIESSPKSIQRFTNNFLLENNWLNYIIFIKFQVELHVHFEGSLKDTTAYELLKYFA